MLSDRLQFIADMVPKCDVLADVGTDHGYLPIALVQAGKANTVYAMDINQGPLDKALQNIYGYGVKDRVHTILSDGLEHLPEEVEVVVIAGMGGMLMGNILERSADKLRSLKTMVLSPHGDADALRRKIHILGFMIRKECMVKDNGKYYTVMVCEKGHEQYKELEYSYGKRLMAGRDKVWLDYLADRTMKLNIIKVRLELQETENAKRRLKELNDELKEIRLVTGYEA